MFSWFRLSSLVFAFWAVVFFLFPRFANESAGLGYVRSLHAEDWTRIVGLLCLGYAVALYLTDRASGLEVRRVVSRGVLAFTLPCALLMAYWQLIPSARWFRLDIVNIVLLLLVSYGMFQSGRPGGTASAGS